MKTSTIAHTFKFTEADSRINDIIGIDETHYLLATYEGLLKTSKEQLINCFSRHKMVNYSQSIQVFSIKRVMTSNNILSRL